MCKALTREKTPHSQTFLPVFNVRSHFNFREVTTHKTSLSILLVSCRLLRCCRHKCTFLPAISFQHVSIAPCCPGRNLTAPGPRQPGLRSRGPSPARCPCPGRSLPSQRGSRPPPSSSSLLPCRENHPVLDRILLLGGGNLHFVSYRKRKNFQTLKWKPPKDRGMRWGMGVSAYCSSRCFLEFQSIL